MTQEEAWMKKHERVVSFIEANHQNPSEHIDEERGEFVNFIGSNPIKRLLVQKVHHESSLNDATIVNIDNLNAYYNVSRKGQIDEVVERLVVKERRRQACL